MEHFLKAAAIAAGVRAGSILGGLIAGYGLSAEHVATVAAVAAPLVGVAWDAMIGEIAKRRGL